MGGFLEGTRKTLARAASAKAWIGSSAPAEHSLGLPTPPSTSPREGSGRSVTHELETLCYDISQFWEDLDDGLKERVKRHLKVVEGTGVKVELL